MTHECKWVPLCVGNIVFHVSGYIGLTMSSSLQQGHAATSRTLWMCMGNLQEAVGVSVCCSNIVSSISQLEIKSERNDNHADYLKYFSSSWQCENRVVHLNAHPLANGKFTRSLNWKRCSWLRNKLLPSSRCMCLCTMRKHKNLHCCKAVNWTLCMGRLQGCGLVDLEETQSVKWHRLMESTPYILLKPPTKKHWITIFDPSPAFWFLLCCGGRNVLMLLISL